MTEPKDKRVYVRLTTTDYIRLVGHARKYPNLKPSGMLRYIVEKYLNENPLDYNHKELPKP